MKASSSHAKQYQPSASMLQMVPLATESFGFLRAVLAPYTQDELVSVGASTPSPAATTAGYTVGQSRVRGGSSCGSVRCLPSWPPDARSGEISQEYMLHRVSQGDEEAVQACIARFAGLVWMLARRVGLPESEIDDIVHEIFTEIWKHGYKYDPAIASETAFVATIARRRLIDRRRKLGRQPIKQQLFEETRISTPTEPRTFVTDEARRAEAALTQLSNEQQRVLRLSVYEGLSHELIARSTGLPLGTVKTHARRGLIKLREILGVTVESVGQPISTGGEP